MGALEGLSERGFPGLTVGEDSCADVHALWKTRRYQQASFLNELDAFFETGADTNRVAVHLDFHGVALTQVEVIA